MDPRDFLARTSFTTRRTAPALLMLAAATILGPLATGASAQDTLIATGASWRYLDDGSDQGSIWTDPVFDDSSWAAGPAQLGTATATRPRW